MNVFMNKFRGLGLIEYNGGLKVHSSLLSVVLHHRRSVRRGRELAAVIEALGASGMRLALADPCS